MKRRSRVWWASPFFLQEGSVRKLMKNPLAMGSIVYSWLLPWFWSLPHVVPYSYSQIISVNGKRDKTASNMAPVPVFRERTGFNIVKAAEVFPISWERMKWDVIASSVLYTEQEFPLTVGVFAIDHRSYYRCPVRQYIQLFRRKTDLIMMRIVDIIYSLPDMLMVVLLSVVLRRFWTLITPALQEVWAQQFYSCFIYLAFFTGQVWPDLYVVEILTIKQNEYVLGTARSAVQGSPEELSASIFFPTVSGVIIISTSCRYRQDIFTESFWVLSVWAFRHPCLPLVPLQMLQAGINVYPYKLIFRALMICLITLAFNLLGDGLRDAFDPKLRR